jgi:hypothetical protein
MAATITGQVENSDQSLLRWSEDPASPLREEQVEVVRFCLSESVIRSALRIRENTSVYIIGKHYTGNGIVRSCREEGEGFLLTIRVETEHDPGIFAVDDFLTEEEESRILEGLDLDTMRRQICCIPAEAGGAFRQFLVNLRFIIRVALSLTDCTVI